MRSIIYQSKALRKGIPKQVSNSKLVTWKLTKISIKYPRNPIFYIKERETRPSGGQIKILGAFSSLTGVVFLGIKSLCSNYLMASTCNQIRWRLVLSCYCRRSGQFLEGPSHCLSLRQFEVASFSIGLKEHV